VCVVQGEVLRIGNEIRCKRIPHNADYRFESCSLQFILETINIRTIREEKRREEKRREEKRREEKRKEKKRSLVNTKTTKGSHHSRGCR
jgi:N-methylhydantoinase A/oxoprolinase/acetone carboxylase beta subunit